MKHWAYYRMLEHHSNGKVSDRLINFICDYGVISVEDYSEFIFKIKLDKNKTVDYN